eukprot:49192-Eustigmatos_ZCMA.PRE.1
MRLGDHLEAIQKVAESAAKEYQIEQVGSSVSSVMKYFGLPLWKLQWPTQHLRLFLPCDRRWTKWST